MGDMGHESDIRCGDDIRQGRTWDRGDLRHKDDMRHERLWDRGGT